MAIHYGGEVLLASEIITSGIGTLELTYSESNTFPADDNEIYKLDLRDLPDVGIVIPANWQARVLGSGFVNTDATRTTAAPFWFRGSSSGELLDGTVFGAGDSTGRLLGGIGKATIFHGTARTVREAITDHGDALGITGSIVSLGLLTRQGLYVDVADDAVLIGKGALAFAIDDDQANHRLVYNGAVLPSAQNANAGDTLFYGQGLALLDNGQTGDDRIEKILDLSALTYPFTIEAGTTDTITPISTGLIYKNNA